MTNDEQTKKQETGGFDWAKIATDALDLWQGHLTSLANDPKAKEEMARMIAPMGQMFADWTSLMQQSLQDVTPQEQAKTHDEPVSSKPSDADEQPAARPAQPESLAPLAPEPASPAAGKPTAVLPPESGSTASSDRARDLAQLAGRLAQLERELEGIRGKRRAETGMAERNDAPDAQRVAGADTDAVTG